MRHIALVYQAGIANVFDKTPGSFRRLLQSDFRSCEFYVRGMKEAGCTVTVYSCNKAGDIAHVPWTLGLDDCPFRDKAHPPQ